MRSLLIFSLITVFLTGCSRDIGRQDSAELTAAVQLKQLKGKISKYKQHKLALKDGWNQDISGCVENPEEGGMGHHFARMDYLDENVHYLQPEVLLYAPNEDYKMELLGAEFIVPFSELGPEADPPVLFNQEFHPNHEQEIWALHVWTEKENPKGIFYPWNPEVNCDNSIAILINELRQLTENLKDFNTAKNAGWNTQLSDCVVHPEFGGMGYHYGNTAYIDAEVDHLKPEILLFNEDENGEMELLGVEYIIPFAILPEREDPPMLFNQRFHKNHELELWALHVWTEKENPRGIFADFNPNVSCSE